MTSESSGRQLVIEKGKVMHALYPAILNAVKRMKNPAQLLLVAGRKNSEYELHRAGENIPSEGACCKRRK